MQGAAPSQAALQGTRQGQHSAALSRLARVSGPATVAATEHESSSTVATALPLSAAVEPATVTAEPASTVTAEPASTVTAEPAASIVAEPASMANVEPAPVVESEAALPGADLTGGGAAEPACLVPGTAAEEEAKEATGLTPVVNHMLGGTGREGRPLTTETGLIAYTISGVLQPCKTLVRLSHTLSFKLAKIGNVAFGRCIVNCYLNVCTDRLSTVVGCDQLSMVHCARYA